MTAAHAEQPDFGRMIEEAVAPLRDEVAELRVMIDQLEEAADIRAFDEHRDDEVFPAAVVNRLIEGENPVKVYREHRGMTQAELARLADTSPAYVSQIETGHREPGRKLEERLADALGIDSEDLR